MSLLAGFTAQREVFLICPESNEIIRLSECVIELPGKVPASPAEELVALRDKIAADERKLNAKIDAEQAKRVQLGQRAAIKQVGAVYPFIDPSKINPADVQVLFDPVLLVAFHGASAAEQNVDVEFIAKQPGSEPEEQRIEALKKAVKSVGFKTYRVDLETGSVVVTTPAEYRPRTRKAESS
jgi:predicted Holliday junction resolvase-like endonuclease